MGYIKNKKARERIRTRRCDMCGCDHIRRDASHIIDEVKSHGPPDDWNGLSLCPTCHRVFDDSFRPRLHLALKRFGAKRLPKSWEKSNKVSPSNREKLP